MGMASPYSASQISEELKTLRLFYARIIAPAYDRPRPLAFALSWSARPFDPFLHRRARRGEGG